MKLLIDNDYMEIVIKCKDREEFEKAPKIFEKWKMED